MSEESNAWIPKEAGEQIEGKIVDITTGESNYGPYPLVTLDVDGHEVAIHAFHHVLRTALARRRPNIGDNLQIKYLGKTDDTSQRRGYHNYRLGGSDGYDWNRDLPASEQAVEPDVPIAGEDLPQPQAAATETQGQRAAEQFGDKVPF